MSPLERTVEALQEAATGLLDQLDAMLVKKEFGERIVAGDWRALLDLRVRHRAAAVAVAAVIAPKGAAA